MDSDDADHGIQNEEQFWDALEQAVSQDCTSHSEIDDVLRSYLGLVAGSKDQFEEVDQLLPRCAYKLAYSSLFERHSDYIRRQFVFSLLQEDDPDILLITSSFLLADARSSEQTFELLNGEGSFPRLVDLIVSPELDEAEELRRLIMQLLYEMSRIQKISVHDLAHVTDDFVRCLFSLIEQVSGNVSDPYHYPVIRVLLVLNEQFMVAAHEPASKESSTPLTNKVVKVLSAHGSQYKTFGENIILLLNREDETSLQLLTLKLLYLLFTTPQTYEYFYTNDLRVLVDILIRNLLDLPEEATSLRHTYLRVLYPLLEHTQLQQPPHYKRSEIVKLLTVLGGGHVTGGGARPDSPNNWAHFEAVDETTKRLVKRCRGVHWLVDPDIEFVEFSSPVDETTSEPTSPVSPSKPQPPALPAPRKLRKRNSSKGSTLTIGQYLAPQLESARQSSLSMAEIAIQREKPGVITPSRNATQKIEERTEDAETVKDKPGKPAKPPPPKARRSGWARMRSYGTSTAIKSDTADEPEVTESSTEPHEEKVESTSQADAEALAESSQPPKQESQDSPKGPRMPPPAPKARRWQFRRTKEVEVERSREPGRFDSILPSIKTDGKTSEQSPFSPVEEKTLSPSALVNDQGGQAQPRSVSEALEAAQAEAVQSIGNTLEKTTLVEEPRTSVVLSEAASQPQIEVTAPPRAVLAPPNPAPPRSIPGPHVEMEKSPFLSDAELEVDDDSDDAKR